MSKLISTGRVMMLPTQGLMLVLIFSFRDGASAADDGAPQSQIAITFSGRVVARGKPVDGAKVYLRESPLSWSRSELGWRPSATRDIDETEVDADGRFEFKVPRPPVPSRPRELVFPLDVIAAAPGRGMAWRHVAALPTAPLELSLPEERKLAGQLAQRDGTPVEGARVRVRELAGLRDPWRPLLHLSSYLDLESCRAAPSTVSDADGRFVLRGVPDGVRATLVVDDDRFLVRETCAAASDKPQEDLIEWLSEGKSRRVPVRSWYCKIEVERAYRLLGKVVFADSGEPAMGARFNHPPVLRPPDGVVGADGRFTLSRLAPGSVRLRIEAPAESSYLGSESEIALSGDNYDVDRVIALPRGELVRGRVVDAGTGREVEGANISYFGKAPSTLDRGHFVPLARSGADGRFTMAVPPGMAILVIAGPVRGYLDYQQLNEAPAGYRQPIDIQIGQQRADVVLKLQSKPNGALAGRIIDADGNPTADAEVWYQGFGKRGGAGVILPAVQTRTDAAGAFAFDDMDASLEYGVRVIDRRCEQGAFVLLSWLKTQQPPLKIKLHSLAAAVGRVVDEQHRPLPAVVSLRVWQGEYGSVDREPLATGADGRFELAGLVAGVKYSVDIRAEGYATKADDTFTALAGEHHALGDVVLPRADKELAGLLLDADGNPIAGAQVRATSAGDDRQPYHASTEVCVTDREGRFRLRGLRSGGAFVWQTFSVVGDRKRLLGQATAGSLNLRFVGDKPSDRDAARDGD